MSSHGEPSTLWNLAIHRAPKRPRQMDVRTKASQQLMGPGAPKGQRARLRGGVSWWPSVSCWADVVSAHCAGRISQTRALAREQSRAHMSIAERDLTHRPACRIELPENYRRAIPGASRRPAGTQVTASPDLDGCRGRIEVRLEHRFVSITIRSLFCRCLGSRLSISPSSGRYSAQSLAPS
jgi:hypothetical protein